MSFIMTVEVESGRSCPYTPTKTDTKALVRWLAEGHAWAIDGPDLVGAIAAHLGLATGPLKTVGFDLYPLDEYVAMAGNDPAEQQRAQERWAYDRQRNENAWHSPQRFIDTIEALLAALQENPGVFGELDIESRYFLDGYFGQDLKDVLGAAIWARDQGETAMRLAAY
jgi:hypothetical protein